MNRSWERQSKCHELPCPGPYKSYKGTRISSLHAARQRTAFNGASYWLCYECICYSVHNKVKAPYYLRRMLCTLLLKWYQSQRARSNAMYDSCHVATCPFSKAVQTAQFTGQKTFKPWGPALFSSFPWLSSAPPRLLDFRRSYLSWTRAANANSKHATVSFVTGLSLIHER